MAAAQRPAPPALCLLAEFADAASLLAANPDATTISIEEPADGTKSQRGRPQEPGREEDDELLGTDDSDKTEVRPAGLRVSGGVRAG